MKTKQTVLTIVLLFTTLLIHAQDKYEFMIIEFDRTLKKEIQISIDGKEYLQEKADYSPTLNERHNASPLLKKVSEYQDKGWEVMNFHNLQSGDITYYYAYLRKKKEDKK